MKTAGKLRINGEIREFAPDAFPDNLAVLVESLGLEPALVVVELNGEIVKRDSYAARIFSDGDNVEIVRLVGGG
ncbi:MAG: sulfur carrier protein ThiS [Planctomycetota bacterium]|jgi:thiamine biosynthesis protein ThiS|nr:sulfur carrier protein ThiS [Planctomycetota bacterium]